MEGTIVILLVNFLCMNDGRKAIAKRKRKSFKVFYFYSPWERACSISNPLPDYSKAIIYSYHQFNARKKSTFGTDKMPPSLTVVKDF